MVPQGCKVTAAFSPFCAQGRGIQGAQHQLGSRGQELETAGPLPVLHSGALRLQRKSSGEIVSRSVQRRSFHGSISNPVPPTTLFLDPAAPPASGEAMILGVR